MPPNNQQPSPPPDYSFITNQSPPPDSGHSNNRKFKVLMFLVIALIMVGLFTALFSKTNQSVKREPQTLYSSSFIKNIREKKDNEAFDSLTDSLQDIYRNQETFTKEIADPFRQTLAVYSCEIAKQESPNSLSIEIYECKKDSTAFKIGFGMIREETQVSIAKLCPMSKEMLTCR